MDVMLAQAVPGFFDEYLKYGVLGLTAAGAIAWAIYKDRKLETEKQERLADAQKAIDLARVSAESLTKWTIAQDNQNKAIADMARAVERLVSK
jgi:hypothetical protein